MSGRSIFDITNQNFGRLDETIKVANDNNFSLNAEVTEDLIIGDYEGDIKKKDAIALQGFTFNNVFEEPEEEPTTAVVGLLDFDANSHVELSSIPDVTGAKTISFNIYLISNGDESVLISILDDFTDFFVVSCEYGVSDVTVYIYTGNESNSSGLAYFTLGSEYIEEQLDVAVVKTAGGVSSVTINGLPISLTNDFGFASNNAQAYIGAFYASSLLTEFDGFLIWDIDINSSHQYPAQPLGNQDSAWIDTIGSINGTVNGSPSTIDIP